MFKAVLSYLQPEWAIFAVSLYALGWMLWEFHAPTLLGRETALSPLLNMPERVDEVEEKQDAMLDKVESIDDLQSDHVQVTRAAARAIDDSVDADISAEAVDEQLVKDEIAVNELMKDG
ncbi:hypothetical protein PN419_00345 [Halorubrum ezzemoulense]|uniref:hypothetical protein n=1 Tax=Halorubrum ezzemoulense TaxID=337243 RepID=UPI00232B61F3|nr:hypothetical protein [Halorubrum ezzemoulense]MDB9247456.1 hypothetical protein [Halorubrum ezzemoulense]MDB9258635.1 hypothetical protein [Halorubrum ezzemoulense]MDB9264507.1 hypothetical protein [Halorubrum ezzemoulense]MDB9268996.1 hypothetical protein [Halorubrum ezzemoulense]MDB9271475.1 hypothetical protein [Halorubrum ezzemoulense]